MSLLSCDTISNYTMKNTFIFLMLVFLANPAKARIDNSPRLFMATKGEHTAFFLPQMHISSKIEKDAYLEGVIENIFRRTTILYDESTPVSHIYAYAVHHCGKDTSIQLPLQEKLNQKFLEFKKFDSFVFPEGLLLQEENFAKIMTLMLGPINADINNLPPTFVKHEGQVTNLLAEKYAHRRESIEGMSDFFQSYCSLTRSERETTVQDLLRGFTDQALNDREKSIWYLNMLRCITNTNTPISLHKVCSFRKSMNSTSINNAFNYMTKFLTVNRNGYWLQKINAVSKTSEIPFYGLGIAHFYPSRKSVGLFTLLKQNGYQIRLIRTVSDVPAAIMSRVPANLKVNEETQISHQ